MTKIEWTEATWNPIVGCSVISPGCTNCYAMKIAGRLALMGNADHYRGTTRMTKAGAVWTGRVALAPGPTLLAPLRRKKPTTYFVNSMGDLFHESVPDDWIDPIFAVMALCPRHTFQVLTKRSKRMRAYLTTLAEEPERLGCHVNPRDRETVTKVLHQTPLANVWLGVSCEDQARADERIPDLLATPAALRFISAEPLLGRIDLNDIANDGDTYINAVTGHSADECQAPVTAEHWRSGIPRLDWVIVGGESGPGARPMELTWARSLVAQCRAASVACFVKQLGSATGFNLNNRKGGDPAEWPRDLRVREMPVEKRRS